jgi:two-component system NtrC family sensor kinase
MAAGIAHELNNPLTSVIGFVELALEELPSDSDHYGDLDLALREAQRAREVVRHLLDFSRQSGSIRAQVDLNELLREVLKLLKHQFQTAGVDVQLEFGDLLPVSTNPNQIKQVALNLLQNAYQAMPGGGCVTIRTGMDSPSRQRNVYFSVSDTGEGIPPEAIERIFEPFFTTRGVGHGTGLGLSVSYGIVLSHGGHIDVKSEVGQGSTFTVWLPLK